MRPKAALGKKYKKLKKSQLKKTLKGIKLERIKHAREKENAFPDIQVNNRQLRDISKDSWEAVHASNNPPQVFQRGGQLIRIQLIDDEQANSRSIVNLSKEGVYEHLTNIANWVHVTKESVNDILPPHAVASNMFVNPDTTLPHLESIIYTPMFGKRGDLIHRPGYHPYDRVWYHPNLKEIPEIPNIPTKNQLDEAKTLINDELLGDFRFVSESDKTHAVAMILLPFVRRMINGAVPLHIIEAPTQGTGKSELAYCSIIIATGENPKGQTYSNDDAELKKVITSTLSFGNPINLFDNLENKQLLSSQHLTGMATLPVWEDRQLGTHKKVFYPNKSLWIFTGNNPRLSSELLRRFIRIRMDTGLEFPWLRKFNHDFPDWVFENRPRLVAACLTIIQYWMVEGQPLFDEVSLGSFRAWAQIIGGIMLSINMEGFLSDLEAQYQQHDEESEPWRELVASWWNEFKDDPKTIKELNEFCELHDLLIKIRGDKGIRSQQTRLGNALVQKKDRNFLGYIICCTPRSTSWARRKATYHLKKEENRNA